MDSQLFPVFCYMNSLAWLFVCVIISLGWIPGSGILRLRANIMNSNPGSGSNNSEILEK